MKQAMATMWKKGANDYESSAKVVDGNLILSLPDAIDPVVWRMELGSVKASALEVRRNADGNHVLALKTPKGDVHDVAPFASRDTAVTALMRISAALQNAEGKIAPVSVAAPSSQPAAQGAAPVFIRPDSSTAKWLLALGGVLIVILLFAYLTKTDTGITVADVPGEATATTVTGGANAETGVPQSADDVLKGF